MQKMGHCCHREMTLWLRLEGLLKVLKSFQDQGKYCLQPVDVSAGNGVLTVDATGLIVACTDAVVETTQ